MVDDRRVGVWSIQPVVMAKRKHEECGSMVMWSDFEQQPHRMLWQPTKMEALHRVAISEQLTTGEIVSSVVRAKGNAPAQIRQETVQGLFNFVKVVLSDKNIVDSRCANVVLDLMDLCKCETPSGLLSTLEWLIHDPFFGAAAEFDIMAQPSDHGFLVAPDARFYHKLVRIPVLVTPVYKHFGLAPRREDVMHRPEKRSDFRGEYLSEALKLWSGDPGKFPVTDGRFSFPEDNACAPSQVYSEHLWNVIDPSILIRMPLSYSRLIERFSLSNPFTPAAMIPHQTTSQLTDCWSWPSPVKMCVHDWGRNNTVPWEMLLTQWQVYRLHAAQLIERSLWASRVAMPRDVLLLVLAHLTLDRPPTVMMTIPAAPLDTELDAPTNAVLLNREIKRMEADRITQILACLQFKLPPLVETPPPRPLL